MGSSRERSSRLSVLRRALRLHSLRGNPRLLRGRMIGRRGPSTRGNRAPRSPRSANPVSSARGALGSGRAVIPTENKSKFPLLAGLPLVLSGVSHGKQEQVTSSRWITARPDRCFPRKTRASHLFSLDYRSSGPVFPTENKSTLPSSRWITARPDRCFPRKTRARYPLLAGLPLVRTGVSRGKHEQVTLFSLDYRSS
jgi:hypothetical protein